MSISYDLVQRYPWLPSKKVIYSEMGSKFLPDTFIKYVLDRFSEEELKDRVFSIFKAAFRNLEEIKNYQGDEFNVYLFSLLKMLREILDNKLITNRIANIYSKQAKTLLENESESNFYYICKDLDLDIQYYEKPIQYRLKIDKDMSSSEKTHFSLNYIDYLKLASGLRDDDRRLANNALQHGNVFLRQKDIARLLQEYVRKDILTYDDTDKPKINKTKNDLLRIKEIKELYDLILDDWELKKEEFEYSFEFQTYHGKDLKESFPPCVEEIFRKIEEGQNIIHTERLFLVFFLHALQFSIDDIVDLFSQLPDFDRKKTEYQVEFAKKKGYSPHSCSTLKSLGLCKAKEYNDKLCLEGYHSKKFDEQRKIQHPLFYLQMKQYKRFKPKTKEKGDKKLNAN